MKQSLLRKIWLVLLASLALPSLNGGTFYDNRSAWTGAVASPTTVDFGSLTPGEYMSLNVAGFEFGASPLWVIAFDAPPGSNFLFTQSLLTVTAPPGTGEVGIGLRNDISEADHIVITATFEDLDTASHYFTIGANALRFWGLTSDIPIQKLTISSSFESGLNDLSYDDFCFGAAVPEPSSLFLAGAAMALCLSRRARAQLRTA